MDADCRVRALYTIAQVRRIERNAIERLHVPAFELMERAAHAAFGRLRECWPGAGRLLLLAGSGNNGGDAYVLGTVARKAGFHVAAVALTGASGVDALRARMAFVSTGGRVIDADGVEELPDADVVVDGLFGIGLARPVAGVAAALIGKINALGRPVLSLDVPSGLDADTGCRLGSTIRAQETVSFIAWKRGQFTADAADCCGALTLASLQLPGDAFVDETADANVLDHAIWGLLKPRSANANKSTFGHVLAIGGDFGMGGAIRLSGEAALRCGAGLVSVATQTSNVTAINAARCELMAHGVESAADLASLIERASVIAIGPGLGQTAWGQSLFDAVITGVKPTVVDADALNLLAKSPQALTEGFVLTPHPGEAARLLGCDSATVQRDRYAAARTLAGRYCAVVVLKGAGSLIANPQGVVDVCPWGNSGMASGGMGDVLTGVIAALLAQGFSAWDAARLGVALHARAGDLAAGDAPRGLIASDLFAPLRHLANGLPR
ncbi:MAG: NAD(P)H-hydrate dehydratase [Dokdonella sp.]|uniref:NAD(P)H-hydrate dehydratase n=1 Tax=Dokdonella sp. TaxID=2291710 RepID=UPI00326700BF